MSKPTKAYILSEIRRTAEANGGKPLGQEKFCAETGLKLSDWSGRYWARWSDALIEAGLQPNKFTSLVPDDVVVGQVAGLVRELGHFPVSNELRMKARRDSSFPSHTTIGRLGGMRELKVRLEAIS